VTLSHVERFVGLIRDETGNVVPPARQPFLAGVLARRAAASGLDGGAFSTVDAYLDALGEGRLPGEWDRLVPMITIKESYFFRAPQQFAAIAERVLPRLVHERQGSRRLRVWCAASARGEEAGTLALILAGSDLLAGWDWRILATDLDAEALEAARRGLYGERSVAHVPPALLERWFRRRGKLYELSAALRRRIDYRQVNLVRPFSALADAAPFDLVLLRNVLIYFRRPVQRRVVAAAGDLLAPDGSLFLGASETLWQIQDRLAAFDLGTCYCYRHRPAGSDRALHPFPGMAPGELAVAAITRTATPPFAGAAPRAGGAAPAAGRAAPTSGDSMSSNGATQSAAAAGASSASAGAAAAASASSAPAGAAGAAGPAAPLEPAAPPEPRLLHADPCGTQERLAAAARWLVANDLAAAERELAQVLASEPSEPAAHALDGFLHDLLGEADAAITSYRAALYLDPALYQVRLLLADLLGRRGQRERAAHQYREILTSLAAGRGRALVAIDELPLPDPQGAERRCRAALRGA
jgi:chemotaxis protein methyltransferase CheR